MSRWYFETTAGERAKTYTLDRAAAGTGIQHIIRQNPHTIKMNILYTVTDRIIVSSSNPFRLIQDIIFHIIKEKELHEIKPSINRISQQLPHNAQQKTSTKIKNYFNIILKISIIL